MTEPIGFEVLLTIMSLTVMAVSRACGAEATVAVVSKELTPMRIEDALSGFSLQTKVSIDLSPDGAWVAYTLIDPQRQKTLEEERYVFFTPTGVPRVGIAGDVWITNTRTGEARNLTGGKGSSWAPSWSPNGHYLAFYSDRSGQTQVWLWERSSGRLRPAAQVIARPYFGFHVLRWTPDSRQILCRVLPEGLSLEEASRLITGTPEAPANPRGTTVTLFRSPAPAEQDDSKQTVKADYTNIQLSDLALLDIETGTVRRLARRVKLDGYWISPDGVRAAYTCYKGPDPADPFFSRGDLVVLSLPDGRSHVAASVRSKQLWQSVSWSPDSRWLSYVVGGPDVPGDCFIVNPDGGQSRCLTPAPHPSFGDLLRAPLWDPQGHSVYLLGDNALWKAAIVAGTVSAVTRIPGQHLLEVIAPSGGGRFWSPDGGNSLYLATRDDAHQRIGFYRVDLVTGQPTLLLEESKEHSSSPIATTDVSRDGRTVVYLVQGAQDSPDLWVASIDFQERRKLTRFNPHLEHYVLGDSRLIAWRSLDGQSLHGALLLPAGYQEGKRCPLIVNVYGGSYLSGNVNTFGLLGPGVENMQLLATRGYAVLLPDAPLRVGTPMQDLAKTILPGIDRAIELGVADPERLGIMGHSYGGYSALALIAQTTRFRAAVCVSGQGDLFGMYAAMRKDGSAYGIPWAEEGQGQMGGTPWQFRDRYIENSPFFYLDRVQTPLLLIQGAIDDASPAFLAEQIFVGLRRLGKEATYARYEGESHFPGD